MAEVGRYRCYVPRSFSEDKLKILGIVDKIVSSYESKGMVLTVRQTFYQMVARDLLPNTQRDYSWLGGLISDGRMAGLISWTGIEDRGRYLQGLSTFKDPNHCIEVAQRSYRIDVWEDQPWRPEVWVEKQALSGVILPTCNQLRVDFFASKGYNSQSAQWEAGQRLANYFAKGQRPVILHFGDHDPSGLDMTRDIQERLSLFAGTQVMVVRLALNMNQVEQYNPPPNPAKMTDSRAGSYVERFGHNSWELDALDPDVISNLIRDAVLKFRDEEIWTAAMVREQHGREVLLDLSESL